MQKRPERRYHSASELITDLKKAISNPDGDFVQIPAFVSSDSPTINISDDLGKIKNSVYLDDDLRETKNLQSKKPTDDDDEELDTVDSKVEKFFLVGSIVAIVILAIVVIVVVVWLISSRTGGKDKLPEDTTTEASISPSPSITGAPSVTPTGEMYEVPNVINLTKADAESSIRALAPNADIRFTQDYSDTIPKGSIMQQYPQEGNKVEENSTVVLTESIGQESFEVPNVYGLTEDKADKKLTEVGLKLIHEYAASEKIESGRVIETKPKRQDMVVKGDTVTVTVSTGPENKQVEVPDLFKSTEEDAVTKLTGVGLVKGNVTYETSDNIKKGLVTYQSYTAGEKVDEGTVVDIIVSSGPTAKTGVFTGKVTIDVNPFDYVGNGEAEIVLEMEQDGNVETIFEGYLSSADFPYPVPDITSKSSSVGTVKMYVNGNLFTVPGDTQTTWTVEFEALEE
jgi:serine/threonine-protein kinase